MSDVKYLCDGKKECGYGNIFCGVYNKKSSASPYDLCIYTRDPEHAKNGACTDPENYPERFLKVKYDYWEKEEPNA